MSDTTITIIAIFLAAVIMFIFPLILTSENTDKVSQAAVYNLTKDFVDKVRTTGNLSLSDYEKYLQSISSTGNAFDVELEIKVLDENPAKKTTVDTKKLGENAYYTMYTSQIMDYLNAHSNYPLKEGDYFTVTAKNTNSTIAQQLKNVFFKVVGNGDVVAISAQHGGMVTVTGN